MSDEKFPISEEDKALFREAMRDVTPLKQLRSDKSTKQVSHTSAKPDIQPDIASETKSPPTQQSRRHRTIILNKTSPTILQPTFRAITTVSSDTIISFSRPGIGHHELCKLRQGKIKITATLDLHQSTVEQALQQCQRFLEQCQDRGIRFALLIHGKAAQTGQPILKNALNRWLRDHPALLAFHTARPYHGGGGALYIIIKSTRQKKPYRVC